MQRFLLAHGADADWKRLADACLEQWGAIPAEVNLGFLYATASLAPQLGAIQARLQRATGITHWIGSVGLGIACTGREYYDAPALAVMVGAFPESELCVVPGLGEDLERFTAACGDWCRRHRHHFGILHGDPRNPATPLLLERLAREVPGAFFVGGLSSSDSDDYPQLAGGLTEEGVSGVLFGPSVAVTTGLTQGCTPLGPRHRITDCDRNVIHRLDDRPALDVLYEDIGEILARDPRRIAGYIFAGLPIAGTDRDDYLVRNLIGLDLGRRRVAVGERLTAGQTLLFCRRDGNSARKDLLRMLRDLRRRLPAPPKGGVYYTCLGRGRYLFGDDSQELRLIRDELGNVPLVGFFANGEISCNRLYGYTGVLTLFS